jgi:hypothetical protein
MDTATARLNALLWVSRADPPRVGYWLARVRVGPGQYGPLCPAAIIRVQTVCEPGQESNLMDRSPHYAAFLAGEPVSIWTLLQRSHTAPERFVRLEQDITEAEYRYRLALRGWLQEYEPENPSATPHQAVDWLSAQVPEW